MEVWKVEDDTDNDFINSEPSRSGHGAIGAIYRYHGQFRSRSTGGYGKSLSQLSLTTTAATKEYPLKSTFEYEHFESTLEYQTSPQLWASIIAASARISA